MKYCPQCGKELVPGERFCQECGFDTSADQSAPEKSFQPAERPVNPTRPPESDITSVSSKISQGKTPESIVHRKGKKLWLYIVLAVIAVGGVGTGGWYGYDTIFTKQTDNSADTLANKLVPEITNPDTNTLNNDVPEPQVEDEPALPKTKIQSETRADQGTVKQKTKEQNKPSQKSKSGQDVKVSSGLTVNNNMAEVILKIGKKEDQKNRNPKNPVKLTIKHPTMIVRITTDHYNEGRGTMGVGSISIKDNGGNLIGTFKAKGKSGTMGTPNAKWVVEPNKVLEKGTYYIWDSDVSTWSKNAVGSGFVVVEGYEIK